MNGDRLAIALVRSGVDVEEMKPVVYRGMVGDVFGLIWGIHRRVRLTDYAECKLGIQPRVRAETRGHTAENTLPPFALLSAVDGIGRSKTHVAKISQTVPLPSAGPPLNFADDCLPPHATHPATRLGSLAFASDRSCHAGGVERFSPPHQPTLIHIYEQRTSQQ